MDNMHMNMIAKMSIALRPDLQSPTLSLPQLPPPVPVYFKVAIDLSLLSVM